VSLAGNDERIGLALTTDSDYLNDLIDLFVSLSECRSRSQSPVLDDAGVLTVRACMIEPEVSGTLFGQRGEKSAVKVSGFGSCLVNICF
jgi:hypothetical protein